MKKAIISLLIIPPIIGCVPETNVTTPDDSSNNTHSVSSRYIKLDRFGNPLVQQNIPWNETSGDEANFDRWSCVQDNQLNKVWEVKTQDNGLRDYRWTYTWYQTYGNVNNAGVVDPGEADGGDCQAGTSCDTSSYANHVNAVGLCGKNNWRVPQQEELRELLLCTYSPTCQHSIFLNTDYFPYTLSSYQTGSGIQNNGGYWTSSQYMSLTNSDGTTNAYTVLFVGGNVAHTSKKNRRPVRLIHN